MPIASTNPITPAFIQGLNPNVTLVARADFSITQITSCFSTPLTIIGPLTGYYIQAVSAMIIRTGVPYNTQPGNLIIQYNTGTPFAALTWASANSPLTQGATKFASYRQFSNGTAYLSGVDADDSATGFGSKSIRLAATVGNPTVGGSNTGSTVTVLLSYQIIPTYIENVGSN